MISRTCDKISRFTIHINTRDKSHVTKERLVINLAAVSLHWQNSRLLSRELFPLLCHVKKLGLQPHLNWRKRWEKKEKVLMFQPSNPPPTNGIGCLLVTSTSNGGLVSLAISPMALTSMGGGFCFVCNFKYSVIINKTATQCLGGNFFV